MERIAPTAFVTLICQPNFDRKPFGFVSFSLVSFRFVQFSYVLFSLV